MSKSAPEPMKQEVKAGRIFQHPDNRKASRQRAGPGRERGHRAKIDYNLINSVPPSGAIVHEKKRPRYQVGETEREKEKERKERLKTG